MLVAVVLVVVLSVLHSCVCLRLDDALCGPCGDGLGWRIAGYVPAALLFTALTVWRIPLLAFYSLVYLVKLVRLLPRRGAWLTRQALLHTRFVTFAALHLMAIGAVALAGRLSLADAMNDPMRRLFTLILAMTADLACGMIMLRHSRVIALFARDEGRGDFRPFNRCLWWCVLSILVDGMLGRFDTLTLHTPLFLIGSNALLLFLIACFLRDISAIVENIGEEGENAELREEIETNARTAAMLRRSASSDALTGAYSRSYAVARMQTMLEQGEPFAAVFIDLDRLKQVNDRHGHKAGDDHLRDFAGRFSRLQQPQDIFARYGGDEFLVLLPSADEEQAEKRMRAVRDRLAGGQDKCPFSFGVACYAGGTPPEAQALIDQADAAMYQDKQRGRRSVQGGA